MPWFALMQAVVAQAEAERRYLSTLSQEERAAYMEEKRQRREAAEAHRAAEDLANRTYRNPESDEYDPLRVMRESTEPDSAS